MPWRHTNRRPKTGDVLNAEDLQEALSGLRAHQGSLNEHNFHGAAEAPITEEMLAPGLVAKYAHFYIAGAAEQFFSTNNTEPTTQQAVFHTVGWVDVANLGGTISSNGCMFRIYWSLRTYCAEEKINECELQVGLTIDGVLIPDSICGNCDDAGEETFMERGLGGFRNVVHGHYLIYLPPGEHEVGLQVKTYVVAEITTEYAKAGTAGGSIIVIQETC